MKKRITIDVELFGHDGCTEQQINDFLELEFTGANLDESEDVFLDDVEIRYNVTRCEVEDV